jgi:hypothetical protein
MGLKKAVWQMMGDMKLAFQRKWEHDCEYLPLTMAHRDLYTIIHRLCWQKLHEFPNLVECRDFNDRIQWLKLFDQDREMIRCSDKVLVRDYVRERVGEEYLVKLYQVHDRFSQIDFAALPKTFVIKANHDSGTVLLVRDKNRLDRDAADKRIDEALKKPYGRARGEWAYAYVQPKVFVEEFIDPASQLPPPDYKFYCVEGKVKFCHYIYDRGLNTKEQTVDPDGNDLMTELYTEFELGTDFKKPGRWDEMICVAERLSSGFKCVRVDLFCNAEKIYAGEMTFWPMGGHYKGEGQKKLGQLLDFDRTTYKPFLLPQLDEEYQPRNFYPTTRDR